MSSKGNLQKWKEEEQNRTSIFPILHDSIFQAYKKTLSEQWTFEEVSSKLRVSNDLNDWKNLSENERFFFKQILSFFAGADDLVAENLTSRFSAEIGIKEATYFYNFQTAIEDVHAITYSLIIDYLIEDEEEKRNLLNGQSENQIVKIKMDWINKWLTSDEPFEVRLLAFAIIEGIFFCGSFAAIFWLKKKNIMDGLCFSNDLIARDEKAHFKFACLLYLENGVKINEEKIHSMVREAVDIEQKFFMNALFNNHLPGFQYNQIKTYIEFIADQFLSDINHSIIYGSNNPFDFMASWNIEGKTNFFENRVPEYSKGFSIKSKSFNFSNKEDF